MYINCRWRFGSICHGDLSKMEMIQQFRVYKSNICHITLLAKQLSNNGSDKTLAKVCPAKNKTIVIFIGI